MAIDNKLNCRIEFQNDELSLPLVTDIFFSVVEDANTLTFHAKKMLIEAEQELVVKSGEAEVRYSGRHGGVTTNAKYITSKADKTHKIQGGTISIN